MRRFVRRAWLRSGAVRERRRERRSSRPVRAAPGAVRGGRADRRGGAHPRRPPVGALGRQAGRGREPAGRRHHRDDHGGREGARPTGTRSAIATNSLLINPAIGMKLPYDTFREIAGVSMIATQPVALVANKAFPANTLAEVVELAKKARGAARTTPRPGRAASGISPASCCSRRPASRMTHINYNGSAPALTDVIAGRVPLMFDIWHSARRYVDSGELKLIAGAGPRSAARRRERAGHRQDLSGLHGGGLQRVIAPAGTPPAVLEKLSADIRAVVDLAGVRRAHEGARHQCLGHHAEGARRLVREARPRSGPRSPRRRT